jgi:hypothetical protein
VRTSLAPSCVEQHLKGARSAPQILQARRRSAAGLADLLDRGSGSEIANLRPPHASFLALTSPKLRSRSCSARRGELSTLPCGRSEWIEEESKLARYCTSSSGTATPYRARLGDVEGRLGSRRPSSPALLLRRLSTSDDHARCRAALHNRLLDQSPLRLAVPASRHRPNKLATLSPVPQRAAQRTSANRPPAPKSP